MRPTGSTRRVERGALALTAIGVAACALLAFGCGDSTAAPAPPPNETRLQGAGATFPQPLYERWVAEYQKQHPDVKIDYQGIGSGGGIKGILDRTVDFAGSDAPMNKSEIEKAGGADKIVEVPTCAGGVVPAYNLPGVTGEVKLTGSVIADIFMGKITKWSDPKITALNAGVKLPDLVITPAYRTDGSGTTFVFTSYLATQSEEFKGSVGTGKEVKWPLGQGGKGSAGVTAVVQQTPGALGYIEQNFADKNNIPYGSVQNKAGKFVKATPASVSAAGEGVVDKLSGNLLAADLWNQPGDAVYPIASFTYVIVYKDLSKMSKAQADALTGFLSWAIHDGQKLTTELDYAPLSPAVVAKVEKALQSIAPGK